MKPEYANGVRPSAACDESTIRPMRMVCPDMEE
jgi:hypothetical protein